MSFLRISALLLPLLWPAAGIAQYRYQNDRWDPNYRSYDYNDRQLKSTARRLANTADSLWNMVRNRSDFQVPQRKYLYENIRDFARNARAYRSNPTEWQARRLVHQAENISRFVDRTQLPYEFRNVWFEAEDQVSLVSEYYGLSFDRDRRLARADPYYGDSRRGSGTFRWRGRVDGSDIIYLRANRVDYRHLSAGPITNVSVDIGAPLPRRPVDVQLRKLQGRGDVRIVEQPSEANDYSVGIRIDDQAGGADFYEFELLW